MLLIGMLDSPFVRRVAISMRLLGMSYEHGNWSVGRDFDQIRRHNPLGRVPTLVLDDGTVLMESAAILDWLDQLSGPQLALLPASGAARRNSLQLIALAIGAAEKGREQIYERVFRPEALRHQPWLDRCRQQMHGSLGELERRLPSREGWLSGERPGQADISIACCSTFLTESVPLSTEEVQPYEKLQALTVRCEALPEFIATRTAWFAPNSG